MVSAIQPERKHKKYQTRQQVLHTIIDLSTCIRNGKGKSAFHHIRSYDGPE
jgi:hypothetical protein